MIHTVQEFITLWAEESKKTSNSLHALTDASLSTPVSAEDRTLGRVAWHLAQSLGEIGLKAGLVVEAPGQDAAVPASATEIAHTYDRAAHSLADAVRFAWSDETLKVEDEMYGEKWTRGETLRNLILHEVHHRGQMSVLIRQAGLKVPGVYGPTREQWAEFGMAKPAV